MKSNGSGISEKRYRRLQAQGYREFTRMQINNYKHGIRLAYLLCISLVITGLAFNSICILSIAMTVAFFGVVLPYHPFDYLYNHALRHITGLPPIPQRTAQARFACGIATVFLAAIIISFSAQAIITAYVLSAMLIFTATLVITTDICLPSIVFNYCFVKPKAPANG